MPSSSSACVQRWDVPQRPLARRSPACAVRALRQARGRALCSADVPTWLALSCWCAPLKLWEQRSREPLARPVLADCEICWTTQAGYKVSCSEDRSMSPGIWQAAWAARGAHARCARGAAAARAQPAGCGCVGVRLPGRRVRRGGAAARAGVGARAPPAQRLCAGRLPPAPATAQAWDTAKTPCTMACFAKLDHAWRPGQAPISPAVR